MFLWIVIGVILGCSGIAGVLLYGLTQMTISEDFDERER